MTTANEPFGALLYAELRKLSGYDLIVGMLNYEAIQRLKQADRQTTLKLFQGSNYNVLQQIKTKEPEEVAKYMVDEAAKAKGAGQAGVILLLVST